MYGIFTQTTHEWKKMYFSASAHLVKSQSKITMVSAWLIIWVKCVSQFQRKIGTQLPKLLQCRNTFSPVPWSHQILWPLDHRSYIFNFGHFRSPLFSSQEDPGRVVVFRWLMDSLTQSLGLKFPACIQTHHVVEPLSWVSTAWLSKKIDCWLRVVLSIIENQLNLIVIV